MKRKNQRADAILAGEGTTTLAPSRNELVSEDDRGATTSEFANSELQQMNHLTPKLSINWAEPQTPRVPYQFSSTIENLIDSS